MEGPTNSGQLCLGGIHASTTWNTRVCLSKEETQPLVQKNHRALFSQGDKCSCFSFPIPEQWNRQCGSDSLSAPSIHGTRYITAWSSWCIRRRALHPASPAYPTVPHIRLSRTSDCPGHIPLTEQMNYSWVGGRKTSPCTNPSMRTHLYIPHTFLNLWLHCLVKAQLHQRSWRICSFTLQPFFVLLLHTRSCGRCKKDG